MHKLSGYNAYSDATDLNVPLLIQLLQSKQVTNSGDFGLVVQSA